MEFKATQKFVLVSPKKVREIVPLIKKMNPSQAVEKLPFAKKRAAEFLRKVIITAIANAKQKNLDVTELEFKEIQINEGPRLKRYRAGARGRAKPYKRKMSHIRVVLTTQKSEVLNPKSKTDTNVQNVKSKTKKKNI